MATRTPFLGLILSTDLTAESKYNLNRLDSLGEIFRFADNGDTLISGDDSIKLSTEAGGTIELGNISKILSEVKIYASTIDLNNATLTNISIPWSYINFTGSSLSDIETRSHTQLTDIGSNTHSTIDSHIASATTVHGITGRVVGTTDTQSISNKTLTATTINADVNTITNIDNNEIKADAGIAQSKIANLVSDLAAKEPTVSKGNLSTSTEGVSIAGGTGAVIGGGTTVNIAEATAVTDGLLSKEDWTRFDDAIISPKNLTGASGRTVVTGGTGATIESVSVDVSTDLLPTPEAGDATKLLQATGAGTTQWASLSAMDMFVRVSATDTTSGFLEAKLLAGDSITVDKSDDPGDAKLTLNNTDKGSSAVASHLLAIDHDDIAHTNRVDLDAVSGTNTGDEDKTSIETKLGAAATDNDGYLTSTDWDTFDGKQNALGFTPANIAGDTFTGLVTLDNLGLQLDTVGAEPVAPSKGQLWWDSVNETIAVKMAGSDVTLQLGQEHYIRVTNNSGVTITNGSVVYINNVAADLPTIALALADADATSDGVIGIVTEDILHAANGYVTTMGIVRGIKTDVDCDGSALTPGDMVYLCPTIAGGFTKTLTPAPAHQVKIGIIIKAHATTGIILVRIEIGSHLDELHDVLIDSLADRDIFEYDATAGVWKNYINPNTVTKEPTGFADPENTVLAYDSTARTITLSHASGTVVYYYQGVRYTRTSPYTSPAHDAGFSDYHFSFGAGDVPTWTTGFPGFGNGTYVAYIHYESSDKFAVRECHGLMPWQAWQEFHRVVGTYHVSGGLVIGSSWTANTDTVAAVTPVIDVAVIQDEDLPTTVPAGVDGATYTRVHLDSGLAVFTPGSTLPYPSNAGDPQYNDNPSSGTALTTITQNQNWFNVYGLIVPTTSDAGSQAYRHLWMTGQSIYGSLALAQAEDFRALNLGDLRTIFPEILPFVRVSYRRNSSYNNTDHAQLESEAITYLSGTRSALVSVSGFTPTDHSTLTGRFAVDQHPASAINNNPTGNLTSTDQQSVNNELQSDIDLRALATAAATRYTAALSWTGAGPYTMVITNATHARGLFPIVSCIQTTDNSVVWIDHTVNPASGEIVLTSSEEVVGYVIVL